ncbi:hypothetical protein BJ986_000618 [Phycicoccus badiiscoriae]|uniref:Uncharacterized protein n=1 Tax=Pedococcus badiiscoriae TaxID=642776 RepID=A0A852WFA4_9MICO|nr:hypothetical protein [Pedococcus badiiscoriae]NYG06131.1 hypothetical protein [Pedococcus badiiscoriae]
MTLATDRRPGTTTTRSGRRPGLGGWVVGAAATLTVVLAAASAGTGPAQASTASTTLASTSRSSTAPLTNLAHLDWLGARVAPPSQSGHTTYHLAGEPQIGTLWTYAEPTGTGGFRHVGGGSYDPATNTYGQGAYNADDMSRAAVVYLRHWRATGASSSRARAYELLRGLTYLQTSSGANAGNVVLWMQPDGTLNPSPQPKELPDPSDSDASYWLARSIWALGEGYAAFRTTDPAFGSFLRQRLDLAVSALDRECLARYGQYLSIDGQRAPAWLIASGADASAEAVLGLSAYVEAGGSPAARTALTRLSEGVADLSGGDAQTWPFGAVRPWALSRSIWHAWASQMPAALARASTVLGDPHLSDVAATDSFTFDPWLLTSGGPDNGRLPTRGDSSQIAYGADSRLESLIATAQGSRQQAAHRLAGIVGAWFFGANPAGVPMYDPATGVTYDGISGNGTVNHNSGAESTIHGLLAMLALDAHPDVAALARTATISQRIGTTSIEAETAGLSGGAHAVVPPSLWTGEALFSGSGYAGVPQGGRVSFTLPAGPASLVLPVFDLQPGSSAVTTFTSEDRALGQVRSGDIGAQGDSPAPGALLPVTLPVTVSAGTTQLSASTTATGGDEARLDALMVEPLVSRLVLTGDGHSTAILSSRSHRVEHAQVTLPGTGSTQIETYDGTGRLVSSWSSRARTVPVRVPAGGFTYLRR